MEVKNGCLGETASDLGEKMNEKMQGWGDDYREDSSDKKMR